MRDYLILAIILGSAPFCFVRPHIGILVFSWLGYMNPHRFAWGAAVTFPVGNVIAIATLAGVPFVSEEKKLPFKRETVLLLLLAVLFTVTTYTSFYPELAWKKWEVTSKILLFTFLTIVFFQDAKRVRYLLYTIALSIGFFAVKGTFFVVATGGEYRLFGPPQSFLEDNNDLALALVMILPILLFLARDQTRKLYRNLLYAVLGLGVLGVMFTYSRGGFLGLATVVALFILTGKHKVMLTTLVVIVAVLVLAVVPGKWIDRMSTTFDVEGFEEESSIQGRFNAWGFAWNLALHRPLTGGGYDCFRRELFEIYGPNRYNVHDAHSIYFEVMGEHGLLVFALFIWLMGSVLRSLLRLRRECREVEGAEWIGQCAEMLLFTFCAYLVSGAFLGRAYFDLTYQLIAVVVVLRVLAERALATAKETGPVLEPAPRPGVALT